MPECSVKNFLDRLRVSQLVDDAKLARAVVACKQKHGGQMPEEAGLVAAFLIEAGLLTGWQRDKLLEGKYKGFFLGRHKLLDRLGVGGMGRVFLAEHVLMERRVAIKVLPKSRVNDPSYMGRLQLEAKAAAALDHPNIVRAYDFDNQGDMHYLVMEFVRGKDLQAVVSKNEPLDEKTAADYIAQAATGLEHAHQVGLVHRDIKPSNLLVNEKGVVKVLDMGLALFSDQQETSLTIEHDDKMLGTIDYISPEQSLDSHNVDARCDIYSLGCTLYFLLTGHQPFPKGTLAQRIVKHQKEMPTDILKERPGCSQALVDICNKMMLKDPQSRYQTAAEVTEALQDFLSARERPLGLADSKASASKLAAVHTAGHDVLGRDQPQRLRQSQRLDDSLPPLPPEKLPAVEDTISNRDQETSQEIRMPDAPLHEPAAEPTRMPNPALAERLAHVLPAEELNDEEFLRRVTGDITGTHPTQEELTVFLRNTSASKREEKIDELLARPSNINWWTTRIRPSEKQNSWLLEGPLLLWFGIALGAGFLVLIGLLVFAIVVNQ